MTRQEQFEQKQASMSDLELIELAENELSTLCKEYGTSFHMSIPPDVKDTDMIFSELIERYKKAKNL